jgi:hypothetical protein
MSKKILLSNHLFRYTSNAAGFLSSHSSLIFLSQTAVLRNREREEGKKDDDDDDGKNIYLSIKWEDEGFRLIAALKSLSLESHVVFTS